MSEQEMTAISEAHGQGWYAFTVGETLDDNPEMLGSDAFAAWRTGWFMAREIEQEAPGPPDAVDELLEEVQATVAIQSAGLDTLVERVCDNARRLAHMLALRAPDVLLEGTFRPGLRRACDALLSREPVWPKEGADA